MAILTLGRSRRFAAADHAGPGAAGKRRRGMRLVGLATWLISALLAVMTPASAQSREAALKAAFLLNFAQFTNWPAESFAAEGAPLVICVFRDALPPEALEPLGRRSVEGRPLHVRMVEKAAQLNGCQLLFVDGVPPELLTAVIEFGRRNACLTVSDVRDFSRLGGHIELFEENNRLRFMVNLPATRDSGLHLSSQLLKLAVIVE
jgi:hypothetical protein